MIGRDDTVNRLAARAPRQPLITIVGPGGIGKTSVALAAAEALIPAYADGVWLIDLAPLADPRLVSSAVASALGLEIRSDDPLPGLIPFLRDKEMLLVLDNCEHVIDAAAAVAIAILKAAPSIHILATSREPLRIEGERVHRLSPLPSPPASAQLTAAEAIGFRPFSCSSNAPRRTWTSSPWATTTPRSPPRSVAGSTGCRWRSSWRRLAWVSLGCAGSPHTSTIAFVC
jgi:predicted ATPase